MDYWIIDCCFLFRYNNNPYEGIVDFILYKIKYASDDRWFRLISVVIG